MDLLELSCIHYKEYYHTSVVQRPCCCDVGLLNVFNETTVTRVKGATGVSVRVSFIP